MRPRAGAPARCRTDTAAPLPHRLGPGRLPAPRGARPHDNNMRFPMGHWRHSVLRSRAARSRFAWALLVLPTLLAACTSPEEHALAERRQRAQVIRHLDHWRDALARPLDERIGSIDPALLDYLALENQEKGIAPAPRATAPDAAFLRDVRAALAELPPEVKAPLATRLAGIYFADNIGSSAWMEQIGDAQGKPVAGVIVLDASVLAARNANAWATWKENTPFRPDPRFRLAAEIADAAHDDRKNAILYNLLHEIGHVLSLGTNVHPAWDADPKKAGPAAAWPFLALSWEIPPAGDYVSRFDGAFIERVQARYYTDPQLTAPQMAEVYTHLAATNLPTLYAATNPFDDFAESFANYVHTTVMKRPWVVRIYQDGKLVLTYGSCWEQPRCAAKRRIIEQMLGRTGA
jgi:hypothetical protein